MPYSKRSGWVARKAGVGQALDVDGFDALRRKLERLGEVAAERVVRPALADAAEALRAAVYLAAPVDTGTLRDSIEARPVPDPRPWVVKYEVRADEGDYQGVAYYAAFVEYGTHETPARPFMRPAVDADGPRIVRDFRRAVAAGIEREMRRS